MIRSFLLTCCVIANAIASPRSDLYAPRGCRLSDETGSGLNVTLYNYPLLDTQTNPGDALSSYDQYGEIAHLSEVWPVSEAQFETGRDAAVYGYRMGTTNFSMKLTGYYQATSTGAHTFRISTGYANNSATFTLGSIANCCGTDGNVLNGTTYTISGGETKSVSFTLIADFYYPIEVLFANSNGKAGLSVKVLRPLSSRYYDVGYDAYQIAPARCVTTKTSYWTGSSTLTSTATGDRTDTVYQEAPYARTTQYWANTRTTLTTVTPAVGERPTVIVRAPRMDLSSSVPNLYANGTTSAMLKTLVPTLTITWGGGNRTSSTITGSDGVLTPVVMVPEVPATWTRWNGTYKTLSSFTGTDGVVSPIILWPLNACMSSGPDSTCYDNDLRTYATPTVSEQPTITPDVSACGPREVTEAGFDVNFYNYPYLIIDLDADMVLGTYKDFGAFAHTSGVRNVRISPFSRGNVYGQPRPKMNFSMSLEGYFLAKQNGTYRFEISTITGGGDIGFIFGSPSACCGGVEDGLTGATPVFQASFDEPGKASYVLTAGTYYPVQIIDVLAYGILGLDMSVSGPGDNGKFHDIGSDIYQLSEPSSCAAVLSRYWSGSEAATSTFSGSDASESASQLPSAEPSHTTILHPELSLTPSMSAQPTTSDAVSVCGPRVVTEAGFDVEFYHYPYSLLDLDAGTALRTYKDYGVFAHASGVRSVRISPFNNGNVYGQARLQNFSMALTGYFLAQQSGSYKFGFSTITGEGILGFSLGSPSNCCGSIEEGVQGTAPAVQKGQLTPGEVTYELTAGTYYPVQLIDVLTYGRLGIYLTVSGPGDNGKSHDIGSDIYQLAKPSTCAAVLSTYWGGSEGESKSSGSDASVGAAQLTSEELSHTVVSVYQESSSRPVISAQPTSTSVAPVCGQREVTEAGFDVDFYHYPYSLSDLDDEVVLESYKDFGAFAHTSGVRSVRISPFNRGNVYGQPRPKMNFSMSLEGYFLAQQSGTYKFEISTITGEGNLGFILGFPLACCGSFEEGLKGATPVFQTSVNVPGKISYVLTAGTYYPVQIIDVFTYGRLGLDMSVSGPSDDGKFHDIGSDIYQLSEPSNCAAVLSKYWSGSEAVTSTFSGSDASESASQLLSSATFPSSELYASESMVSSSTLDVHGVASPLSWSSAEGPQTVLSSHVTEAFSDSSSGWKSELKSTAESTSESSSSTISDVARGSSNEEYSHVSPVAASTATESSYFEALAEISSVTETQKILWYSARSSAISPYGNSSFASSLQSLTATAPNQEPTALFNGGLDSEQPSRVASKTMPSGPLSSAASPVSLVEDAARTGNEEGPSQTTTETKTVVTTSVNEQGQTAVLTMTFTTTYCPLTNTSTRQESSQPTTETKTVVTTSVNDLGQTAVLTLTFTTTYCPLKEASGSTQTPESSLTTGFPELNKSGLEVNAKIETQMTYPGDLIAENTSPRLFQQDHTSTQGKPGSVLKETATQKLALSVASGTTSATQIRSELSVPTLVSTRSQYSGLSASAAASVSIYQGSSPSRAAVLIIAFLPFIALLLN